MINTVIIDDEPHCIERLLYVINNYCAGSLHVTPTTNTAESGLQKIKQNWKFLRGAGMDF